MTTLLSAGYLIVGLLLTTVAVKIVAAWMNAEQPSWGRAFTALLLSYFALIVALITAAIALSALPGSTGLALAGGLILLGVLAIVWAISAQLGTTKIAAVGIAIVAVVVNVGSSFAVGAALVALGIGVGVGGIAGIAGVTSFIDDLSGAGTPRQAPSAPTQIEQSIDAASVFARVEVHIEALCECRDESCQDGVFPALMDDLGLATESAEVLSGDVTANQTLDDLIARIETCQELPDAASTALASSPQAGEADSTTDSHSDGDAVAAVDEELEQAVTEATTQATTQAISQATPSLDARSAFARVEVHVNALCECRDESCQDGVFPNLMDDLGLASESPEVLSGDPSANQAMDDLIARIETCQELPDAGTTSTAGLTSDSPTTVEMSELDEAANASPVVEPSQTTGASPADKTANNSGNRQAKPTRYYVLRAVEKSDLHNHVRKLVRITLVDGRTISDQLVGVENDALVLKRDRANGGTLYVLELSQVAVISVFGL